MRHTPLTEEKALETFPTKGELKEFKEEFTEFKDQLYDKLDYIVGQLETIRDEQTLAYHQHKELEEKVDNHEKRITTLESSHS